MLSFDPSDYSKDLILVNSDAYPIIATFLNVDRQRVQQDYISRRMRSDFVCKLEISIKLTFVIAEP